MFGNDKVKKRLSYALCKQKLNAKPGVKEKKWHDERIRRTERQVRTSSRNEDEGDLEQYIAKRNDGSTGDSGINSSASLF